MNKRKLILMMTYGMIFTFSGLKADQQSNSPSIQVQVQREGQSHFESSEGANVDNPGNEANADILRQIEERIKGSYGRYNINIRIVDGVVVLKGTVNTSQDKDNIEKMVRSISGVDKVNNKLEVQSSQSPMQIQTEQIK